MTPSTPHALACADALARPEFERHLHRFRKDVRPAVRDLAMRHPRLAELSGSFPALLVALALPRARFDAAPAIARAVEGAPLTVLAEAARVPLWLRRMAPELICAPIPELPDSLLLRRRIVNHLPSRARFVPNWFSTVARAAHLAHDPFALWCARLCADDLKGVETKRFERLCLWAWFSTEPTTRAYALIERVWSPEMELKAAVASAEAWAQTIELYANLGEAPIAEVYLRPGNVQGYDFRPLRSADEIVAEGKAMRNCVRTYGERLARNRTRLWSVQRRGRRVATMCISWRGDDPLPSIWDLKLSRNRNAPAQIWLAARKWLNGQELLHLDGRKLGWPHGRLDRAMWRQLWRPYWLAKQRFTPSLPLTPSREALDYL